MFTISQIVRMKAGTVQYIEMPDNEPKTVQRINNDIKAKAARAGGKCRNGRVNGFDSNSNPIYLMRIEVIEQGRPYKYKKCEPAV